MKLSEVFGNVGFDCCDKVWDFLIYVECEDNAKEGYDRFCKYLCDNVDYVKTHKGQNGYLTIECDFDGFIRKNIDVFTKFCNEENEDNYQPQYWLEAYGMSVEDICESEDFYDLYMTVLYSLIAGNYSDSDYDKLVDMLEGE